MSENIRVAVAEGVCTVTISRPEKKNSLTRAMYAALADAIETAADGEEVRALLLAGEGDIFCAGNDIGEFRDRPAPGAGAPPPPSRRFYTGLAEFPKPVVAAVPGLAIGIGCTMLMHADIVYAAPEARFRLPFVDLGVVPELGSSLLLPRMAGRHRAAELMLLGEFFGAEEAREIGLVNRVMPRDELLPNATATARALARKPQEALRQTKRLLRQDMPALMLRMQEELEVFDRLLASPETQAIMAGVLKPRS